MEQVVSQTILQAEVIDTGKLPGAHPALPLQTWQFSPWYKLTSAVQSTCSLFSWMHCSPCMTKKSPLEEIGSGLWMCIINCATGKAARAVLCRGQHLQGVTASLSSVGRAGSAARPSHTLWRSGRKLPPGNIPKAQYINVLKKGRRKLLWLCLPHKCPIAGVRVREHDKRWQYEFRLSVTLPSRLSSQDNQALISPYIQGVLLESSVFSEKFSIFRSAAWKWVFTPNLSRDLHGYVGTRLEVSVCWKKLLPLTSCSIK